MPSDRSGVGSSRAGTGQLSLNESDVAESDENPYLPPSSNEVHTEQPQRQEPMWVLLMKCGLVGLVVDLVSRMLRAVATVNG